MVGRLCNLTCCGGSFYPVWVEALLSEAGLYIAQRNLLSALAASSLHEAVVAREVCSRLQLQML